MKTLCSIIFHNISVIYVQLILKQEISKSFGLFLLMVLLTANYS